MRGRCLASRNFDLPRKSIRSEDLGRKQDGISLDVLYSADRNIGIGHGIERILDGPEHLVTISSLLRNIGKTKNFLDGRRVHHHIIECRYGWEVLLGNCLMQMYGSCGLVEEAQFMFDNHPNRDTYSWNILTNVYGNNKGICHAHHVFSCICFPNVVSWNIMIKLLSSNGHGKQALDFFHHMQIQGIMPNDVTCIAAMEASALSCDLEQGKRIHVLIIGAGGYEENILVDTALINMYGRCGCLRSAKSIFDVTRDCDVVTWTAMIGCLAQNGCNIEALEHFQKMQSQFVAPNDVTFLCAMEACASVASLEEGHRIHAKSTLIACEDEVKVSNALIDMYNKCGSLKSAFNVFRRINHRTVVSWNALIVAYGQHGLGKEAIDLFWRMQKEGIQPDGVTFIAMMNACSHNGLIEDGLCLFLSMDRDHNLAKVIDHYVCVIDLFGRAGRLDEAEHVASIIHCERTTVPWLCLLAACRIHSDVERGSCAAKHCFKQDPSQGAPYIVLSNLYTMLVFSSFEQDMV